MPNLSDLKTLRTSVGPAAVPVSVVRAVRDAGSARQSGPLRICILVLGCRRSSISTHVSSVSHVSQSSRGTHQSVTSVKAVVARGAVAACNGAATRSGRPPDNRHTTHNGRLSRTIGHRAANNSPHRWGGGRIPHTPEQHRHLTRQRSLDVAGALPSVLSRRFNGGVRPRAAPSRSRRETSEPHAMRACAMAPLAPCLRQID